MTVRPFASLIVILFVSTARAQWQPDGTPVCTAVNDQLYMDACADGAGGAVMAWVDYRSGADIYAQRIDINGYPMWTANGVHIGTADGDEDASVSIIPSGIGGACIAWVDAGAGNENIYVQRIDGGGAALWTVNGVAVCSASGGQYSPQMALSADGTLTVVWVDGRDFATNNVDVYANLVSSTGTPLVGLSGFAVYAGPAEQRITSFIQFDSEGTALVVWTDLRNLLYTGSDIFGAFITDLGAVLEVPICTDPGDQSYPSAVYDGNNGAIIAWSDERQGQVFAQRLNESGTASWAPNGVVVGDAGAPSLFFSQQPALASDGAGGAIVSWRRWDGVDLDLFAQRLNASGTRLWNPADVTVCNDATSQSHASIAIDNTGGAVIAWTDDRAGIDDIYAQRLSSAGAPQWTANGVEVCVAAGQQLGFKTVPDMAGGTILAWVDDRGEFPNYDIYANRVLADGQTPTSAGGVSMVTRMEQNFPNPFNPETSIPFTLGSDGRVVLRVYDVSGKLVATLLDENRDAGEHVARWNGRSDAGAMSSSGIYFARLETRGSKQTRKLVLLK